MMVSDFLNRSSHILRNGSIEVGYYFHFFCIDVIINFPAGLLLFKQFTLGEYLQMFRTVGLAVSKFEAIAPAVMDCEATNRSIALLVGSAMA